MLVNKLQSTAPNPKKVAAVMKRIRKNQKLEVARQNGLALGMGDTLYKAIHGMTISQRFSKKV